MHMWAYKNDYLQTSSEISPINILNLQYTKGIFLRASKGT